MEAPFGGEPFPCLLWHRGGFTRDAKRDLAHALIHGGCRYAVCAGVECEAWHDAFDAAFLEEHEGQSEDESDRDFMMTTWHERDTIDDVAFFFVLNTNFDDHDFTRYLVLHVGDAPVPDEINAAVAHYAMGGLRPN